METSEVKEIYNRQVKEKFGGDYEYRRWFSDGVKKSGYEMTKKTILRHLFDGNLKFSSYLEIGPGSGIWTKFFYEHNPAAYFLLADISSEMLKLAKEKLGPKENIKYWEGDFISLNFEKKFDFFFSCRAIEYLPDKSLMAQKINNLLAPGAVGFLITKTPKYFRNKISGRELSKLHQGQIPPKKLKKILLEKGFVDIEIYPATLVFPLLKMGFLNKALFSIFSKIPLNFLSEFFSESYCVKFKKSNG